MERLSGPTMLGALLEGSLAPAEAGREIARLLRQLHAIPARDTAAPVSRVLHLDLHPDNVILTPAGPRVIDWSNTENGTPGLDWAMPAVILAQVAVSDTEIAAPARTMLTALLADPTPLTPETLKEARTRRAANPTMTPRETELLGEAEDLIRTPAF